MSAPKYKLVFLPGLGANAEKKPSRKVIGSGLGQPLLDLCQLMGWTYATPKDWDLQLTIPEAVDVVDRELTAYPQADEKVLVVASSYGGWIILYWVLIFGWPAHLEGLFLLNPFFTLEGFCAGLPKAVLAVLKLFAKRFGFSNLNFGPKHYWVPAVTIRSMLDPRFNVLKRRLYRHTNRIYLLDNPKGRSSYKTPADMKKLCEILDQSPFICDDQAVISMIGGRMEQIERSSDAAR